MTSDDVAGCACCTPRIEDNTPTTSALDAAPVASDEEAGADSRDGPRPSQNWAPKSCTLPTTRQPMRMAEFDALFSGALQTIARPEPSRLRLVLDPDWEDPARHLAEQESQCCSFFTFAVTRHDDELHLDITVPAGQQSVLDALAQHAAALTPEGAR